MVLANVATAFVGQKQLDDDDWEPVEDQGEFGVLISWGKEGWPVHIAIDLLGSTKEETVFDPFIGTFDLKGSTSEIGVGVRKIWQSDKMRPHLGGGIALVNGEIEGALGGISVTSDDSTVGAWVDGGIFWRLGNRFNIGFDARYSKAEIKPSVSGVEFDVEAGGLHAGLLLGFGW